MTTLNANQPAYLAGQLCACLTELARPSSVPGHYRQMQLNPSTAVPVLLRNFFATRRGHPAAARIDRRVEDIIARLPALPCQLSLEQQGAFALGYAHERAAANYAGEVDEADYAPLP